MKSPKLFPNSKMKYEDYIKSIHELLTSASLVACKDNLEAGTDAILNNNDPIKQDKLIKSSLLLDKEDVGYHTRKNKIYKQLPVIMTVANLLVNHYENVEDLSIEQLVWLGHFMCVIKPDEMKNHLRLASCKELLQSIMDKTDNPFERNRIFGVIERKYFTNDIDKKDDIELNNFLYENVLLIKETPKEDILSMARPIEVAVAELEQQGFKI